VGITTYKGGPTTPTLLLFRRKHGDLTHASFARQADVNVFSQFGTGSSSGRKWRLKTKIVKHTDIAPRVKIKARNANTD
jgi:hypothetical protein